MTEISQPNRALPSFTNAPAKEQAELLEKTKREEIWYDGFERFVTNADITAAAEAGKLQQVEPDENIMPIYRLRNSEMREAYPPYLLPVSALALSAVGRMWRQELRMRNIDDPHLRLATTSFVRSEEAQAVLVADPTKLANPNSTHCVGGPFDIDESGYYWQGNDGVLYKVSHPDRDKNLSAAIGESLGNTPPPPDAPVQFEPAVMGALVDIATRLHEKEWLNNVTEYERLPNQCGHLAPNPAVPAEEWQQLAA